MIFHAVDSILLSATAFGLFFIKLLSDWRLLSTKSKHLLDNGIFLGYNINIPSNHI